MRLPCLGKRELILVFFVRLFDLRLFGFVCFLFLLVSGKGCRFLLPPFCDCDTPGLFSYFFPPITPITDCRILKCIKSLKNNKVCGNDDIINEYIKNTSNIIMSLYNSFFNLILETGMLPDAWLEEFIRPIYKHKGDLSRPENYRPIIILSCFGKHFTAILNLRLNECLNTYGILKENQAGFRAGYSTNDHILLFTLLVKF